MKQASQSRIRDRRGGVSSERRLAYALRGFGRPREAVVAVHSRPDREGGQAARGEGAVAEGFGAGRGPGAAPLLGLLRGELRVRVPSREAVRPGTARGGGAPRQAAFDLPLQAE